MTTTSIGTRLMAANSSSEFEAAATTCNPRSLRRASAKSWVWMRVPSATTILTKSEPNSSWDGIGSLLIFGCTTGRGDSENTPFVRLGSPGEGGGSKQKTDQSL